MRKHISRHGQPVELTLYEVVDGGAQGDFANELTTTTAKAVVDTGGNIESDFELDLVWSDVDSDIVVYLRDDVTEGLREENYDGDMVRPVITSVDTTIPEAATELEFINQGPMNAGRTFRFVQAHDWDDAGIIMAAAELD